MNLLRRLDDGAYGEVEPVWAGGTAACVATGPSLTAGQIEVLRAARLRGDVVGVVVVNDAYLLVPWADVLYFCDAKGDRWLDWHRDRPAFQAFGGQKCMLDADRPYLRPEDDFYLLRNQGGDGLSPEPGALCTGGNTGHQAINLAALSGAKRILLLGYDGKKAADGREHFFGRHPNGTVVPFDMMRQKMKTIPPAAAAMGIEIINCTPGSAIDCFPGATLESVLPHPEPAALSA